MGVLATNSAALLTFSDSGTARLIPDGIAYDDAGMGDIFVVRRPDGPDGERLVLFGGDWDLFGRIDLDEDADAFFRAGERGPGSPEWTGFSSNGDLMPGDDHQALQAAGIERLIVPDLDEEDLARRVAEATGVEAQLARARIAEACRTLAAYGFWPKPVPAEWNPLA